MTTYVALRSKPMRAVVVDELYNLQCDDEIVAEVSEDGRRVHPRNPEANPKKYWWPLNMFLSTSVELEEFVRKLVV